MTHFFGAGKEAHHSASAAGKPKSKKILSPKEVIESFRKPVAAFAVAANNYLDGEKLPGAGEEWNSSLENLLCARDGSTGKDKTGEFFRNLGEIIAARPALALMALGYITLAMLRSIAGSKGKAAAGEDAAGLASRWQLDRVLRECWEEAGIPHDEARRGAEIALALLSRTNQAEAGIYDGTGTPSALASALILENYDAADFRKILGVNRFDDVTWFNKEAFEQALFLIPFFLSLEGPHDEGDRRKRIETIAAVAEAFRLAEEESGYRFDDLAGALSER